MDGKGWSCTEEEHTRFTVCYSRQSYDAEAADPGLSAFDGLDLFYSFLPPLQAIAIHDGLMGLENSRTRDSNHTSAELLDLQLGHSIGAADGEMEFPEQIEFKSLQQLDLIDR